jgi:hypothetical protein
MESTRIREKLFTTQDLTLSAALAAFYIVSTFIPVDAFLGGAAIISLEIVTVPVIAALLKPPQASATILVGSLGMAVFQTGTFPVFGIFALLVPIIATILGSFAFHYRYGSVLAWAYVLFGAVYYLAYSKGGTLLWLIPYIIVIASLPVALKAKGTRSIPILAFYTAMTWQVTLNILSIGIAGLLDGFWSIVTPFMLFERTIATVGSVALITALKSRLGTRLGLNQELVGR